MNIRVSSTLFNTRMFIKYECKTKMSSVVESKHVNKSDPELVTIQVQRVNFGSLKSSTQSVNPSTITSQHSIMQNLPTLKTFGLNSSFTKVSESDTNEVLPDNFSGTYKDDFNILEIHELILKRFQWDKKNRHEQLQKKRDFELHKIKGSQNMVERKNSLMQIEQINRELDKIRSDEDLKRYMTDVSDLVASYKELGTITKVISFKPSKPESTAEDSERSWRRHMIIAQYLEIAQRYLQIDVVREIEVDNHCVGCGTNLDDLFIDETNFGSQHCPVCGIEREVMAQTPFYRDISRINTSSRNNYDDRDNFYKAMMRYQGKQQIRFPDDLMSKLDQYFESYGLPKGSEVKTFPLDKRGRRDKTNKEMMYKALYDIGYPGYYEDDNLLCHLYWGWVLPDISHLEEAIMGDYDQSQWWLDQLDDQRSFPTQLRLYKHLRQRGHPCFVDDFKVVKTRDILEYHEKRWQQVCLQLGWESYSTI